LVTENRSRSRGDGKELYFLAPDGAIMATPIDTTNGFQPGIPQSLFVSGSVNVSGGRQYSVTKDGKRFLVLIPRSLERGASPPPLTVVVNWLASEAR
jgi:hypothetical protein